MTRESLCIISKAFIDPNDPAFPGSLYNWYSDPFTVVSEIASKKNVEISEDEIKVLGVMLTAQRGRDTLEMQNRQKSAETIISDAKSSIKPAYLSTIIMHNVTFYLGVGLILLSVYASHLGLDLLGNLFGAAGILDVTVFFYYQPVKGLTRSICNQIQLEILYSSYVKQSNFWSVYQSSTDNEIKTQIINEMEKNTMRTMELIEQYCKEDVGNNTLNVEGVT